VEIGLRLSSAQSSTHSSPDSSDSAVSETYASHAVSEAHDSTRGLPRSDEELNHDITDDNDHAPRSRADDYNTITYRMYFKIVLLVLDLIILKIIQCTALKYISNTMQLQLLDGHH